MATKIYVGNLPWRTTDEQLEALFAAHGDVADAKIVTDRETARSRGFGFVTMADSAAAQSAIEALNGHNVEGRNLVVNEAHEQGPRNGPNRGALYRPRGGR
ncbi:MAG: RNA recognition motif domain-containing protein [Burkholderiaceae bacterium]